VTFDRLGRAAQARRFGAAGSEAGSASLWTLSFALVVLASAVTVVACGVATVGRHRAAAAADLAALAGAAQIAQIRAGSVAGQLACDAARTIARANDAQLVRCSVDDNAVWVVASVELRGLAQLGGLGVGSISASARAGPG
jgi:secretion/DNA translocation related TadE-like protein